MSVFSKSIRSAKLSDFETPRAGEHPVDIDPNLVDFLPQQRTQHNPGLTEDALDELGENMQRLGQIQHAVVRPNPDSPGRYIMVAGERRCRAAQKKGLKLRVIVRDISQDEHVRIQRAENIHREALTNREIAEALKADKDRLGTLEAVAAEWQKSINWVSERLRYLEAVQSNPVVQKAIETGVTGDVTTLNELSRLAQQNPDAAEKIITQADEDPALNIRQNVREKLKATKPKRPSPAKPSSGDDNLFKPQTVATTRVNQEASGLSAHITAAGGNVEVLRNRSLWQVAGADGVEFQTLDSLVAAIWEVDPSTRISLLPPI